MTDLIDQPEALRQVLREADAAAVCAVDTEADSLHRYRESLCLIQFAWADEAVLIDPLGIDDLSAFYEYLNTRIVWMHGADYDMTMLRRECGLVPEQVYDTQIGARLLGLRQFGLSNLVEHYFGVTLSKSSQKADWGKRPLSAKMAEYALNDVNYLLPMADMIVAQLKEKNRYDWFLESCEWARGKVIERDETRQDPWRITGSGGMSREALNLLKHLWYWRDGEAEKWDRPSFMVANNKQLIRWVETLLNGGKIELPKHFRSDRRRRFHEQVKRARQTKSDDFPERIKNSRRRRDKGFEERVDALIRRRNRLAEELDIDNSVIASRPMIEAFASDDPAWPSLWMNWQRVCLNLPEASETA